MTSQTGQQIITIHILTNISRSKGKQAITLGQSIDYNMRNTKRGVKTSRRPFMKNQDGAYLHMNSLKYYKNCFYCMSSRGLPI